jgi:Holliday junction resolvasome RuvABC DNA-binding subunit
MNALLALGYNEREALTAMKGLPAEVSSIGRHTRCLEAAFQILLTRLG